MKFTKMHGLGNDYLYVVADALPPADEAAELSRRWSDRHTGVGSDGIIWLLPATSEAAAEGAEVQMRIFNADGSEAMMCGNGIRCVGKLAYERGLAKGGVANEGAGAGACEGEDASSGAASSAVAGAGAPATVHLKVETLSGIRDLDLRLGAAGRVESVTVDMGPVRVSASVQMGPDGSTEAVPVNVGNPHAVVFSTDADRAPVAARGPILEHDAAFPGGVNVEFATVLAPRRIRMRVWERGSGITRACGTGACATAAAAVARGLCPVDVPIEVELDGGALAVTVRSDGRVFMTGPAAYVCDGETID